LAADIEANHSGGGLFWKEDGLFWGGIDSVFAGNAYNRLVLAVVGNSVEKI
jgi:hypothetical protein